MLEAQTNTIKSKKRMKKWSYLSSVPGDHLVWSVVTLKGEVDLQDVVAGLDDAQDAVNLLPLDIVSDAQFAQLLNL